MRAVVQRIYDGSVTVEGNVIGEIERGLLVYLGVKDDDTEKDVDYLVHKILGLRIYEDDEGKMNISVMDKGYDLLVVSQFTLYGDTKKGKRPSFIRAAGPEIGNKYYELFVKKVKDQNVKVATGEFGAHMEVAYTNDGPVTILIDSEKEF